MLKLTKKLVNLQEARMLAIMPDYVTNGHWLARRDVFDNASILNAPDDALAELLGGKSAKPEQIQRWPTNDNAERVIPRGERYLRATDSGLRRVRNASCDVVILETGPEWRQNEAEPERAVLGVAADYWPLLEAQGLAACWAGGEVSDHASAIAGEPARVLVMASRLGVRGQSPDAHALIPHPDVTLLDRAKFNGWAEAARQHEREKAEATKQDAEASA